ncbi:hypothetical protein NPIL_704121 [Nephila pilipes]|uniref:Uncharacterized protein n=1 Tax=Nephila pilipes TaxID=299642 RepID=A0A8X6M7I1_NEPPI|nr:hypothetical protein NPIL_704121 [Nephila pilipes]
MHSSTEFNHASLQRPGSCTVFFESQLFLSERREMNQIHFERFVEHGPGRGQAWKPKVSFPFVSLCEKSLLLVAKSPYQLLSKGVVDPEDTLPWQ